MSRRAPIRSKANGRRPGAKLVVPVIDGVETSEWSDLPPAAYPPATIRRVILPRLAAGLDLIRIDGYLCDACQGITITYDLHPGIAPGFVDHDRFDPDTRCPGQTRSLGRPVDLLGVPSHEFYRPSEDELVTLPRDVRDAAVNHVLRGGLLLRVIPAGIDRRAR